MKHIKGNEYITYVSGFRKRVKKYPYFAIRNDSINKEELFELLERRFYICIVRYIVNIF